VDAEIITLTGRSGLTVMVIVPDMAGLPVAQVSDEMIAHMTASPWSGVYVYSEFVAPETFVPFTFH